jgi:predicted SnoaL-like aldol condensation-catalyzing enzyme
MTASENKQLALHAFQEFANGNIEVLRPLLHEDFVEHSPGNPSGRDAFIEFIAEAPVAGAQLDLRRVIADDEYVVMHYLMTTPGKPEGEAWSTSGASPTTRSSNTGTSYNP